MARKLSKKDLQGAGGWGRFKKSIWGKAKKVKNHVKRHAKKAIAHGKKVARATLKSAKQAAIAAGKEMLEQAKQEAKDLIAQTVSEAKEAALSHVKKHVCSTVGSGFFDKDAKKIKAHALKHLDSVHKKGLAHIRSGGKGSGIEDHVAKAGERFDKGVERVKNSAKARIRAVAGCDEGEGFQLGKGGTLTRKGIIGARKAAAARKKKGAGYKVRGAGLGKKKCRC